MALSGADPGFVGPEACTLFGVPFEKKNRILRTKLYIYLEREKIITHYDFQINNMFIN
jgi:hypothetical protein